VDARHLVEKIWTHYVLCAYPVSTIRNPPPPSTHAPKLPNLVQEVTIDGAKTEILASLTSGAKSYIVGRQKQGMKYSGPYTSSIDTNSYQPLSHCYITAQMAKQLCLFIAVISLIS